MHDRFKNFLKTEFLSYAHFLRSRFISEGFFCVIASGNQSNFLFSHVLTKRQR